jgi:D-alanyl-D-alanine carboxypeptidase
MLRAFVLISMVLGVQPAFAGNLSMNSAAIQPIPDMVWAEMQGKSFHADVKGCAQRAELVLLTVPYWDYQGTSQSGQLIVAKTVGRDLLDIFTALYTDKSYAFARVERIDSFGGDDRASLVANNTSAYNCRVVAGSTKLSAHAKGLAIDINPVQNPFVTRKVVSPPAGKAWDTAKERAAAKNQPGMILHSSAVFKAFKAKGWTWGGDWTSLKDYQHFSKTGN